MMDKKSKKDNDGGKVKMDKFEILRTAWAR
jgi:hypothetical protein